MQEAIGFILAVGGYLGGWLFSIWVGRRQEENRSQLLPGCWMVFCMLLFVLGLLLMDLPFK